MSDEQKKHSRFTSLRNGLPARGRVPWNLVLGAGRSRSRRFLTAVAVILVLLAFPLFFVLGHVRRAREDKQLIEQRLGAYESSLAAAAESGGAPDFRKTAERLSRDAAFVTVAACALGDGGIRPPGIGAIPLIDLQQDAALLAAAKQSRKRRRPVLAVGDGQPRLLIPMYAAAARPEGSPQQVLNGWLVAHLDLGRLFLSVLPESHRVDSSMVDVTSGARAAHVRARIGETGLGLRTDHRLEIFGREWRIERTSRYRFWEVFLGRDALLPLLGTSVLLLGMVVVSRRHRPLELGERMLDTLNDVIMVVDAGGRIGYVSPSIERAFGLRADALRDSAFEDLFHPDDAASLRSALLSTPATGVAETTVRLRGAGDQWYDVAGTSRRIIADGKDIGYLVTMRDVTDVLQMSRQLEQSARVESLGRVAATIAHEFNNVLQGLQSSVEVLQRKADDPQSVRSLADTMKRHLARGKHIAEGVLRFAQPARLQRADVDVERWVETAMKDVTTALHETHPLRLRAEVTGVFIIGDESQLTQIMTNLILNARDASPRGKPIQIVVTESAGGRFPFGIVRRGEYVHIEVADEGSGIPAEIQERIFEPLFTTKRSGTGLGLAVCQQIIASHHGEIFVGSVPGEGTRFHIFLPVSHRTDPREGHEALPPHPVAGFSGDSASI